MRIRKCPLCDQPMKKQHRCDSCNSFIWKPEYIDVHFNTEVTGGANCSYDSEAHERVYNDDGSVTSMPSKKRSSYGGEGDREPEAYDTYKKHHEDIGSVKKKNGAGRLIVIVVAVIVLMTVLPEIILGIFRIFESEPSPEPFYGYLTTEDETEDDDDWVFSDSYGKRTEYSDEEVIAGGRECTGMTHIDMDKEHFVSAAESLLAEMGVDVSDHSEESSNFSYDYGNNNIHSYYSSVRMYYLEKPAGSYYNIDWDTATGNLHTVSFDVMDREGAEKLYIMSMQAITGNGEHYRDAFLENLDTAEEEGYVFYYDGDFEIYIAFSHYESINEDSYYISIDKGM